MLSKKTPTKTTFQMSTNYAQPLLLIVSAPSGAGKTSLIQRLIAQYPNLLLSTSYTTRAPRSGEVNGREYHFVTPETFNETMANDGFIEYAQVHQHFYGTPKTALLPYSQEGRDVITEIDWQGARSVRLLYPSAVSVFILPPSIAELEKRLIARGKDSIEVINRRIQKARDEINKVNEFDFVVVNDDFDRAYQALANIYEAGHFLRKRDLDINAL